MTVKPYSLKQAQDLVADAVHRSSQRHKDWRAYETLYRTGDFKQAHRQATATGATGAIDFFKTTDRHTVNMVLPHLNVMVASVIARDPRHLATAMGGGEEAEVSAKTAEAVVRYFWLRAKAKDDLVDATWDMVRLGNGFVKVGWNHAESEEDRSREEVEEDLADLIKADGLQARLGDRDPLDTDELVGLVSLTNSVVEIDEPFVEYVSPYDVFVPANARRMHETRWVCHRVTLPVDEVEANPAFTIPRDGVVSDGVVGAGYDEFVAEWVRHVEDEDATQGTAQLETATLFEFYDMRSRRLVVFQMGSDKPLFDDELPFSHRYPPLVHLRNYSERGSSFWSFGDLENIANSQALLNEFLSEQINNARRAGNKYVLSRDAATDDLIEALESDEPDRVALVDLPNGARLDEVFQTVERKALSGDIYGAKVEMEDYLRKILGVNDFMAGGNGADRMSATAAAVVDGIATLRATEKVQTIEAASSQIGTQILLLCQEFLDTPKAIRISGSEGAIWPDVSRDDLRGEFDVTVEGGSTQSINPATREQRGMRLLGEVMPLVQQAGFDPTPAMRQGLRDLGFDPDILLKPLPAPEVDPMMAAEGGPPPGEGAPAAAPVEAGGPTAGLDAQLAGGLGL